MMRKCQFLLLIFYLISCGDGKKEENALKNKANVSGGDMVSRNNLPIISNDTFCVEDLKKFETKEVKLIRACHIILSDSSDRKFALSDSIGKILQMEYNLDKSKDLFFNKKGDTLEIKILFNVLSRNIRRLPDSLFMIKDTLFLREKGQQIYNDKFLPAFKYEVFFYQILLKKQNSHIRIQHIK